MSAGETQSGRRPARLAVLALLAGFIPLLAAGPALSQESYRFKRMWPTPLQPWYFHEPAGVAVDRDGNLYVANRSKHQVHKFNAEGYFITSWGGYGAEPGQFSQPADIDVDEEGFVYVADRENHRVQKFTPNGNFVLQFGRSPETPDLLWLPDGIVADGRGRLYVTAPRNQVAVFSTNGRMLYRFGTEGSGEGELLGPKGLFLDTEGHLYVAEKYNHRVQKLTVEGQWLATFGQGYGSGRGQFHEPYSVAVDGDGNVYVVDRFNHRVQKFDPQGRVLAVWGGAGFGDRAFFSPQDICLDREGNLLVADGNNNRIQKYSPDGRLLSTLGSGGEGPGMFQLPVGVGLDEHGHVYVADTINGRVQKFTAEGELLHVWGGTGIGPGKFLGPFCLAPDGKGHVYVTDFINCRVQKFTADGAFVSAWGSPGTRSGQFLGPSGIALDGQGFVYVVDSLNARVQKFSPEGEPVAEWGGPGDGPSQMRMPTGIAVSRDGTVYVVDTRFIDDNPNFTSHERILKFTADGAYLGQWGGPGSAPGRFDYPYGAAVDDAGYVYVADSANNRIQKFAPDGTLAAVWGTLGSAPGQLSRPFTVAVAGDGRVYVVDNGNHRVQVFEPVVESANNKAVIVSGGSELPGNSLRDATQMNANLAYRALVHQGYTGERILYLTQDRGIDVDGDGTADDDGEATLANLEAGLSLWAADADSVLVYLVGHGGDGTFRMNAREVLEAGRLALWLDRLQAAIPGTVTVVYDACEAGSFLGALAPPPGAPRIVVTSTSPGEPAYFVTRGSVSFSSFFWTHVFNGSNLLDAYQGARAAMGHVTEFQRPLLDDNGDGVHDERDGALARGTYPGNATAIDRRAPVVGSVYASPAELQDTQHQAAVHAEGVSADAGVSRVWAVIRPPVTVQGPFRDPVQGMPGVELKLGEDGRYSGVYGGFTSEGTYLVTVYAQDRQGNLSAPATTRVTVRNPLQNRAVLVAGAAEPSGALWRGVERAAYAGYRTLRFQGFGDDQIQFLCPVTSGQGVDGLPSLGTLEFALSDWLLQGTRDLVLYLVGEGGDGWFALNARERLYAGSLGGWLREVESRIQGRLVVIYDGCRAGSFLDELLPPEGGRARILILSAGENEAAHFLLDGEVSFSSFFWRHVAAGATVESAFRQSAQAVRYSTERSQTPLLDDNGDGRSDKHDGALAGVYVVGPGIVLADSAPLVGSVSPPATLSGGAVSAEIRAEDVTSAAGVARVFALVSPPGYLRDDPSRPVTGAVTVELEPAGPGSWTGVYGEFDTYGMYEIAVYAVDARGNVSLPATTSVTQRAGPDVYEEDDGPDRAVAAFPGEPLGGRNFHRAGDEDWTKFYGLAGQTYSILVRGVVGRSDPVLEVYGPDRETLLDRVDMAGAGGEEYTDLRLDREGVHYVRVLQADPETWGEEAGYELLILTPEVPLPGYLQGVVSDRDTGALLGDVIVKVHSPFRIAGLTRPDGRYLIPHPAGTFDLEASRPDYSPYACRVSIGEAEYVTRNIDLARGQGSPAPGPGLRADPEGGGCGCAVFGPGQDTPWESAAAAGLLHLLPLAFLFRSLRRNVRPAMPTLRLDPTEAKGFLPPVETTL